MNYQVYVLEYAFEIISLVKGRKRGSSRISVFERCFSMEHCAIPASLLLALAMIASGFGNNEEYCFLSRIQSRSDWESYPQFSLLPTSFIAHSQERKSWITFLKNRNP